MSVYLAAVGNFHSPTRAVASIERIKRREGDSIPHHLSWTSGTLARQLHVERFLETGHDQIFMLDQDMEYPSDCLERLRSYGEPLVSGLYLRRDLGQLLPAAWKETTHVDDFPMIPLLDFPLDALIPAGAIGHGYCLVHREVVLAVQEQAAGGPVMLRAPMPEWTGQPDLHVGTDVRFFLLARRAGYRLWVDTGCRAKHYTLAALDVDHYLDDPTRHAHDWFGKTALARMVRRGQMGEGIGKEELMLMAEHANTGLNELKKRRAELEAEVKAYSEKAQAELTQIDNSIHAHNGQLILLEQQVKALSGEMTVVREPQ